MVKKYITRRLKESKAKRASFKTTPNKAHPHMLVATWGYVGFLPMSGTAGTIAALPFAWGIYMLAGDIGLFLSAIALTAYGAICAHYFEKQTKVADAAPIVVDEVAAMWLVCSFLPLECTSWVLGFIFFRVFDWLKPYPACLFEGNKQLKGWGVMLDDSVAAIYAVICALVFMEIL